MVAGFPSAVAAPEGVIHGSQTPNTSRERSPTLNFEL
jgi:hypothetical protein